LACQADGVLTPNSTTCASYNCNTTFTHFCHGGSFGK